MPDTNGRRQQERLRELSDGYALGVLEGEDLEEMKRLLARQDGATGDMVSNTMRSSQEIVGQLAWGSPGVQPPEGLRQRVLDAVDGDTRGRVVTLRNPARQRGGRMNALVWLGWAAAAALAAVVLLLNSRVRNAEQDLAEARNQATGLRMQVADRERVLAIIGARDARSIRLVTAAPEAPQFRAYWSESAGLVLTGNGVASPRTGRTLQLWIVPKKGAPISAGVFAPTAKGDVLLIASNVPSLGASQALAISDEPVGGSAQPTTKPAWIGALGGF